MENNESITIKLPKSQIDNLMNIASKFNWEVVSKSDFAPTSLSDEAQNSDQFVAMLKRYVDVDAVEACNGAWPAENNISTEELISEITSMRRNSNISEKY